MRRDPLVPIVCGLQLIVVADANAMSIALPSAGRAFAADAAQLQWIVSGYSLCFGAALLAGGRTADVSGRRRMLLLGSTAFAAGAAAAALATSLPMLIVARSMQGLGAAIATPAALALLSSRSPNGDARNRDISSFGTMVAIGFLVGVFGGGWLAESVGWRAVPAATAAVTALIIVAAARSVPPETGPQPSPPPLVSPLLLACAMVVFVLPVSRASELGWDSPQLLAAPILAGLLLVLLTVRERAAATPLVPRGRTRATGVRAGLCAALVTLATSAGATYALILYLQRSLGFTPLETGWGLLAFGIGGMLGGTLGRRSPSWAQPSRLLVTGLLIQAAGCLFLAEMPDPAAAGTLLAGMTLMGFGNVLATITFTIVALADTPRQDHGIVGGLLGTAQQIGATLGLAVSGAILAGTAIDAAGLSWALVACAATSGTGAIVVSAQIKLAPSSGQGKRFLIGERGGRPGHVVDDGAAAHDE